MIEQWRDVAGFEGMYEVSNQGRVRSLDRVIERIGNGGCTMRQPYPGKVLKLRHNADGYLTVRLCGRLMLAHRIVAAAFIGDPSAGEPQVDHRNGVRDDNLPSNLRWANQSANNLNRHAPTVAASGEFGVRFRADRNRWQAYANNTAGFKSLGHFVFKSDAIAARAAHTGGCHV